MQGKTTIKSMVVFAIASLTSFSADTAHAGNEKDPAVLMGEYVSKTSDSIFRSFKLTDKPGVPGKPLKNQKYYRYAGTRKDGTKDAGVWWATIYKGNKGYLMFESKSKDFIPGKRNLQFAIYDVGKDRTLSARPTHLKGWPTKKPEKYTKRKSKQVKTLPRVRNRPNALK